ncbi:hypothetical protein LPJ73_009313, partial [Coemansia sp. RSA 2703]
SGSTNSGSTNTGSTNTGSNNTGSNNNNNNSSNNSNGSTDNGSSSGTTSNNNNNNNNSSDNSGNESTDSSSNGSSNGNSNSVSSSKNSNSSVDSNGRNVTDKIDEGDVVTINGSVIAVADLMTNSNEANLEVTHVYYLTQTDDNGNVVVISDIEVQTFAYSDYHDNTDDNNEGNPKDSSGLNASADNEKYNGLSRSAVIAIGVVVPVVTILILLGLFFLHKWWRRRRNAINWDPKSERDNINRIGIIDEMGMAENGRPSTESDSNTINPSNPHSRVVSAQIGQDGALAE